MQSDVRPGSLSVQVTHDALTGELPSIPSWLNDIRQESSQLPWSEGKIAGSTKLSLGEFTRRLKQAEICDSDIIAVPGAVVVLPWGVELCERFAQLVRGIYGELELQEYAYPQVVPESCFSPMADLLDLRRCLLRVGTEQDSKEGRTRGVLTPTGEQVIANHWRHMVSRFDTLPIRLYQRARYFRPISSADRSGKGVFSALEAPDVFEFHCCHATEAAASDDIRRLARGLLEMSDALPLPQFIGVRPPWGNRNDLYEWGVGGDTPLLSGECVQTSAVYCQGQRISRRYDIGFGKNEQRRHAWQVDGFVSRRMMYAQLGLSTLADGSLIVHPNLAPIQIAVLARSQFEDERQALRSTFDEIKSRGLRATIDFVADAQVMKARIKQLRARGVPLLLLYFGRRHVQDAARIRLCRPDNEQELAIDENDDLPEVLSKALADVEASVNRLVHSQVRSLISFAQTEAQAKEMLAARKCVIAPIAPTRANVEAVANWRMGELCSFAAAEDVAPCIFSGRPTRARALLSRRI
ncbi:hypothetical protein [Burkholderia savannae]|uniref:hypothetical protein n=1 Tax=Burkholderia savannae TaxID=1637837 RepID=UPI0012E3DA36|nr:hypothetical protein [Burkholderia savannae]